MRTKLLAFVMAIVMLFAFQVTAFAAEPVEANLLEAQTVPAVAEVLPANVDARADFAIGNVGYISNCGNAPKFKFWVTGGDANTQVMFNVRTSGGTNYGPFGPVKANGANYATKSFVVFEGKGTWNFTAYVSAGSNTGLVCHVQQIG